MHFDTFAAMFEQATKRPPFRYQQRFAEAASLYDLVPAPTGAGKTATALLGWLYRRRFATDAVRQATPRRLVYCLPMRTLVEQTAGSAARWIDEVGLADEVPVHKLLGGDVDDDWALRPERDAVLVGTQDMLLSRALNRGYAQGRFRWPIDFGLLNSDCLWVFDELQLMGAGVSTSAQLAGLRGTLGTFGPGCPSVWMSATLDKAWLGTVDFRDRLEALRELELSDEELTAGDLGKRMQASKVLRPASLAGEKNQAEALARAVRVAHKEATLTLVVLNTVDRAKAVFEALRKQRGHSADLMLVHSRFRPPERELLNARLMSEPGQAGRIIVATQVVEAGVDVSARALFTELAPWPSLVQRLGRCHRYGELAEGAGEVYWVDLDVEKLAAPYSLDELVHARKLLGGLAEKDVSPLALRHFEREQGIRLPFKHQHVLRRRDLLGLFDTAPDLSGNDVDVSRFVRGDDPETDVSVFWRDFDPKAGPGDQPWPRLEELCPAPLNKVTREFLTGDPAAPAYRLDHWTGGWEKVRAGEVRPGMVLLLPTAAGGYDWNGESQSGLGWCADRARRPRAVDAKLPTRDEGEEAVGADPWSQGPAQTLAGHTTDVCDELETILAPLGLPPALVEVLREAARWHDLGKAHPAFQASVRQANPALAQAELWAKSGRAGRLRHPADRKHFRHELASALAMLQQGRPYLTAYLAAAHHGRVRLAIRSLPDEMPSENPGELFALGVRQGDKLPEVNLVGVVSAPVTLDLSPMRLGEGSWTGRALDLLSELGPFKLAYLEALLRAADMRASKSPRTGVRDG